MGVGVCICLHVWEHVCLLCMLRRCGGDRKRGARMIGKDARYREQLSIFIFSLPLAQQLSVYEIQPWSKQHKKTKWELLNSPHIWPFCWRLIYSIWREDHNLLFITTTGLRVISASSFYSFWCLWTSRVLARGESSLSPRTVHSQTDRQTLSGREAQG